MADIGDAFRLRWICDTIDTETATWGMACARVADADLGAVHTEMENFYTALTTGASPILAQSSLRETQILEWIPAQTRWAQKSTLTAIALDIAGSAIPMQCALVATLHANIPTGGRRQSYANRSFLGPLVVGSLETDGKVKGAYLVQTKDRIYDLHQAIINTTGLAPGVILQEGLAVVSETLGEANPAVLVGVGSIVDTQRSRRRNLVEERSTLLL